MSSLAHSQDDYVDFCEGLRRLCDVDLLQYRRGQMERRIRSFAARRGIDGLADYLALLRTRSDELDDFLDRVTINVSQLWRNPEQWCRLASSVLPELAQAGRICAWSAGCSYGAEPYTLAAICRESIPRATLEIRGTDIDSRMIARARLARFSAEDTRHAPPGSLERFFTREGDTWLVKPELRALVSFEVGDLLRMRFPRAHFDLVLCRNTVIYFTDDVRDGLHARLVESLRPGGYLMIGSTERVAHPTQIGLEPTFPFIYRKS